MYNHIFQFEIKTWLKSPLFYFLIVSFFLFSLVTMLGTGGYFDGPADSASNVKVLNSPYAITYISFLLGKALLLVVAIFAGFSLYRDYKNDTHAILYSFPVTKLYYLNGKLCSVILALITISVITFSGIFLGETLLGIDNPKIGPHSYAGYITTAGLYLIPTLAVIGIFVFIFTGISRNIFSGFVVVICFVLFQSILENVLFKNQELLAVLDPFGQNAFQLITKDWNIDKQNSHALPVSHLIVWNRLLWTMLAFLSYVLFVKKFELQYHPVWQVKKPLSAKNTTETHPTSTTDLDRDIQYNFSTKARVKVFLHLMIYDFKSIFINRLFWVLNLFGAITIFFIQLKISNTGAFNLHPFTRIFIGAPLVFYTLLVVISTFLFSGLLINKSRQHNMHLIADAAPVKNGQVIASKIGAISLIHITQLLLFLITSLLIQVVNGYYNFEFELYAFHLFILVFPTLFVWNITSHFIHTLFPNLFLALFLLLAIWLGSQSLDQIGIHTNILKYNTLPALEYSDFNGYGDQLKGYLLLLAYWLTFGILLIFVTALIWNRGSLYSFRERMVHCKSRFTKVLACGAVLLIVNFIWIGVFAYNAELHDKNVFMKGRKADVIFDAYKKEWEPFNRIIQPKITKIDLSLDLFPNNKQFQAQGTYLLVNKSNTAIDTLFVRTGFDEVTTLDWDENAQLIKENSSFKSYLYKLNTAMHPGDSTQLTFRIKNTKNTIFYRNSNVLSDGSYLKHDILPRLGYQFTNSELPLNDSTANIYNYFHRDADYVHLTTTISTQSDQIAIAPGELIYQTKDNERNYYTYTTPKPVKINFSFHSGKYRLLEERYKNINVQLFYTKGHHYNTALMMEGLKAAIDFNTKWFGEYPYTQIRIIEFPHTEESYSATLTSNNIPASEIIFNINSEAMGEKVNLPFYVMAHELTHEWFGNQLMPAGAEGAKMLTESITEYITLAIYRNSLGEEMANKFLDAQYNRYHRGKKREKGEERPLYKVLSQQEYIAYGKGAIALNTIADVIGKDKFHSLLQQFLIQYKSQTQHYPTTMDFIALLKDNTNAEEYAVVEKWLIEISDVE